MNLRDLRYLLAVAEHRHFGRAAEACFVSQPTLSGQIKKLEERLGVTLFERGHRSVEVTTLGRQILTHAERVIGEIDAIERLAHANHHPLEGPFRLGIIPTLGPYLMPLILGPLRRQLPQLHLVLNEEMTSRLTTHLYHHELDAALLATAAEPGLIEIPLFDEPFWLAHPSDHPLRERELVTEADLPRDELLLLAEGHCLTDQVMNVCKMDSDNEADLRASSLETLIQLVGAGLGCTLVPALALSTTAAKHPSITLRPITVANAERRVRLVTRATFPHRAALDILAELIKTSLPDTVTTPSH